MLRLLLLLTSLALGRSTELEPGWVAEQWTVRDGLPSDMIYDMAEDPTGGLLLATADGLVHFDGRTFDPRHAGEPGGAPDEPIIALAPDGAGGVWAVTGTATVQHRTASGVRDYGRLAKVTRPVGMGANTFPPLLLTDAGVFELRDPPVPRTDLPTGIWRILVDEQGAVLSIGDASFVWDPASGALQPTDHEATHARERARYLLMRQSSRYTFGQEGFARDGRVLLKPDWPASRALEIGDATWVSTGGAGLFLIHPTPLRTHPPPAGTEGAASVLYDALTDAIWAMHPASGRWWSPDGPSPRFERVQIDGRVWTAAARSELTPYATRTRRWWWTDQGVRPQASRDDEALLVLGAPVTAPDPDTRNDAGWVSWALPDGSLMTAVGDVLVGETWRARSRDRSYMSAVGRILAVVGLPGGGALLGGFGGLVRVPDDGGDAVPVPGMEGVSVRHLRLDDGWIWASTQTRGLCATAAAGISAPVWRCLGTSAGLDHPLVHASLQDALGRTWVSTNRGFRVALTRALQAYARGERSEVPFLTLDETWGLPSAELNGYNGNAALARGDGRLWFPGAAGVVEVRPDALVLPTALVARASPPLPAALPADHTPVETHLVVEPLAWARSVQLRVRVGDGPWVATGPDLHLGAFPAGVSPVVVQARLLDDWQTVLSAEVDRAPRLTERAFFPLLVGVGVLGVAVGVAVARNRALLARQAALAAEITRQTADLAAQNRQLGQLAVELTAKNQTISEQATRLQQLDELKRKLIADLAHELRTPLTLVMGALEQRSPDVPTATRNAARLQTLLDELFDLSRLEAGSLRLRARRLDLVAFAAALAERFQAGFEAAGRALTLRLPPRPVEAWADAHLLEKVVGNLLVNALRHGAGHTELALEVDEGWARVEVADEGPGVPEADRERIFERFVQLSSGDTRAREGAGIGLALARELVELHGGDIGVTDGARFRLRLPLGQAHLSLDDVDLEERPRSPLPETRSSRSETFPDPPRPEVLLVEDNDELRGFMASLLGERWTVAQARDGREGLEAVRRLKPGLVVSDVRMPRLDGLGLARAMRADPSVAAIPILFVSAKTQEEDRVAGLELGDDYLTKPFGSAELLARAQRLLRAAAAAEPLPPSRPAHEAAFLDALAGAVAAGLSNPDFSIAGLARKLAMSERSLQGRMKELDLPPPSTYLLEARLGAAKAMLRAGTFRTVSEVAAAVGLSRAYFTRAYTAWDGQPPGRVAGGTFVGGEGMRGLQA